MNAFRRLRVEMHRAGMPFTYWERFVFVCQKACWVLSVFLRKRNFMNEIAVGVQLDGMIDVGVAGEDENWTTHVLDLREAEFLHEELGRAIARQKERGFSQPVAAPKIETSGAP